MPGTSAGAARRGCTDGDPSQAEWDAMDADAHRAALAELEADIELLRATMPPWTCAELAWEDDRPLTERTEASAVGRTLLLVVTTHRQRVDRRKAAKGDG
jgi:hypothetical protein